MIVIISNKTEYYISIIIRIFYFTNLDVFFKETNIQFYYNYLLTYFNSIYKIFRGGEDIPKFIRKQSLNKMKKFVITELVWYKYNNFSNFLYDEKESRIYDSRF